MATIGNRAIASMLKDYDYWAKPDGFRIIGEGSYRAALLHEATNVVYKVAQDGMDDSGYTSNQEVRIAKALAKRAFKHVRIPQTSAYKFGETLIVAMEFVAGDLFANRDDKTDTKWIPALIELFNIGFSDMHGRNFIVDTKGMLVPIDMASPTRKSRADCRVLSDFRTHPDVEPLLKARGWW